MPVRTVLLGERNRFVGRVRNATMLTGSAKAILTGAPVLTCSQRPDSLGAAGVGVALLIGTIELLQVFIDLVHPRGAFFDAVAALDISSLGYAIVGMFLIAWGASLIMWKLMRR